MNNLPSPVLANLADNPAFSDVVRFQLTGLVVVFGALAVIWLLVEIVGAFFRKRDNASAQAAATAAAAAAPVEGPVDGIPEGVVAAIAAAVQVTMDGQSYRVSSIKASRGNPNWAAEGRREHFSSHRVR